MQRFIFLFVAFFILEIPPVFSAQTSWQTSLSYDSGGVWLERIPVEITNDGKNKLAGFPVAVPQFQQSLGNSLRVVRSDGQEVIFGFDESALTIPVDAEPGETARYYVYTHDSRDRKRIEIPKADMLDYRTTVKNGGFQHPNENKTGPQDWAFDEQDDDHRLEWASEDPHFWKKCVKTVVAEGAEPSWISARQNRILIQPGAKYRFSGRVKAENLNGIAGWYIHVGPEGKPFTISPMLTTNENSFDWKYLETEFTAPADAAIADVGTVLRGTGTAWFDDVKLELLDGNDGELKITVGPTEKCPLKILPTGENDIYLRSTLRQKLPAGYECLSQFRIVNDSESEIKDASVLFDLRSSFAHGRVGLPCEILVENSDKTRIPGSLIDPDNRQATAKLSVIPPRSVNYINVYYKIDETHSAGTLRTSAENPNHLEATAHPELQIKADPYAGFPSLLKDGDFENGSGAWVGEGTIENDPNVVRFGKSCAKVVLDEKDAGSWRGYRQTIPVDGGRSYLISAWLKCKDLSGGGRIHLHFYREDGKFCASGGMTSMDREIRGTVDWTHVSQVITAPNDAASMSIHLTTNQPGTLWYDNLAVLDSLHAELVEVKSLSSSQRNAWQVPAVMKVFPQSLPPRDATNLARISAARNEKEPLQIAVRNCGGPIKISELVDDRGNKLPEPEICLVGYVPVDYPSNYYNDTNPKWYRKSPQAAPGCDGWPGIWPDPLIPRKTVDRTRTRTGGTNAFWITWSVPKDAVSGIYRGSISFVQSPSEEPKIPEMPVEFTVYDFTLPDMSGVSATYDARFTGPRGIWADREIDAYREGIEIMGANRLEPDEVKPAPKITFKNGKFEFDWADFDRAAEHLFDDLHVRYVYMPNLFYLFGWGHPPKDFFGEKPYDGDWPFADADRSILRPEYKERYQAALREFWNHVKEKGWAGKFVHYISDEPNHWEESIKRQMIALCAMIHEVDPAIPIYCSTWGYVPEWADSLDVWGIGHYGIVPPETMDAIRARGSRIWFTTDGMMCLDTPYCAIERLLPHYCFKYGAEAYEFWGIGWLTYDPWKYGFHAYIHQSSTPGEYYWVRYPNGDGYLLYPGIRDEESEGRICSSIRLEQAREGVEDYEYLRMLQTRIDENPHHPEIESARKALEDAKTLVECPTQIGRYSTRILPDPYRLEQLRENVARAIEKLHAK